MIDIVEKIIIENEDYFNEKDKYYLNDQKYFECQLVSAINAAIYLTEIPILQNNIEYERLVDLSCARCGAAINIESAHKYLRIVQKEVVVTWKNVKKYLTKTDSFIGSPIEATIFDQEHGNHSVLIIDCHIFEESKEHQIRVLNCSNTDDEWWIDWKVFYRKLSKHHITLESQCYRFEINPWYLRDLQIQNNLKILKDMKDQKK